ncbi:uncharacterized protein L201_006945 [Kwoniella dendrophila CBS 6074]|uniref:Protein CPL1-like domain-containing protein n=1 Tax=Kwoniella dendrophila CBS 6074 TaxID=1295534 RepID=A0AAX4K2R7_9TREE
MSRTITLISIITLIASSIKLVNSQATTGNPLFLGCTAKYYYPDNVYDAGTTDDALSCAVRCSQSNPTTFYSNWALIPQDVNRCYCTDTPPDASEIQESTSPNGGCDDVTQSTNYFTSSTFNLISCKSTQTSTFQVIVETPELCLQSCKGYTYSILSPQLDGYHCTCSDSVNDLGPQNVNCNQNIWLTYQHEINSYVGTPSGFVKRQQAQKQKKRLFLNALGQGDEQFESFCPVGLKACKLSGNDDDFAFECLNVNTELESCGGCLYGDYGISNQLPHQTYGQDCTSLPGVAMGAVTCTSGECVAYACEQGYELGLNSTCISLF